MAFGARKKAVRGIIALIPAAALALAGCGSPWRSVPVGSVDESTRELGDVARFTLNDQRVIDLQVTEVKYPFVEGHRLVGKWTNGRLLRVDLRDVAKIEVRGAS